LDRESLAICLVVRSDRDFPSVFAALVRRADGSKCSVEYIHGTHCRQRELIWDGADSHESQRSEDCYFHFLKIYGKGAVL
jgi:hypothetical protein